MDSQIINSWYGPSPPQHSPLIIAINPNPNHHPTIFLHLSLQQVVGVCVWESWEVILEEFSTCAGRRLGTSQLLHPHLFPLSLGLQMANPSSVLPVMKQWGFGVCGTNHPPLILPELLSNHHPPNLHHLMWVGMGWVKVPSPYHKLWDDQKLDKYELRRWQVLDKGNDQN